MSLGRHDAPMEHDPDGDEQGADERFHHKASMVPRTIRPGTTAPEWR